MASRDELRMSGLIFKAVRLNPPARSGRDGGRTNYAGGDPAYMTAARLSGSDRGCAGAGGHQAVRFRKGADAAAGCSCSMSSPPAPAVRVELLRPRAERRALQLAHDPAQPRDQLVVARPAFVAGYELGRVKRALRQGEALDRVRVHVRAA